MASHAHANRVEISNLDEALERIRQLEEIVGLSWQPPRILALTRAETEILGFLMRRRATVDYESLYTAMYGMREDPPEIKVLAVLMCKLRKKLSPHNVAIQTVWGRGVYLAPEMRTRIVQLYDEDEAEYVAVAA